MRAAVRSVIVAILLMLVAPNVHSQDQEPNDRFQTEFLSIEYNNGGSPPDTCLIAKSYIYDLTNGIFKATNITVWEDAWKAIYAEDWETNIFTWAPDPDTGVLLPSDYNGNKHYIAHTNFNTADPVITPERTVSTSTNTFNFTDQTADSAASSGWKGRVDGKDWNMRINFIPKGNQNGTNTIKRLYQVTAWVINEDTKEPVPFTNIMVLGKTLDTNGIAHVVLDEASTNNATPTVTGVNNYYFAVGATRIMVDVSIRTTGELVQQDLVGYGYQSNHWVTINQKYGTNLGGTHYNPNSSSIYNLVELSATVPSAMPTNGWTWHRDVARKTFIWNSTTKVISEVMTNVALSFQGPPGNDTGGTRDNIPDNAGAIYDVDAPRAPISNAVNPNTTDLLMGTSYPDGSIMALRFFAREWIEWNGAIVSEICHWHSFNTVTREGQSVDLETGKNEAGLTQPDPTTGLYDETPQFTVDADGNPN